MVKILSGVPKCILVILKILNLDTSYPTMSAIIFYQKFLRTGLTDLFNMPCITESRGGSGVFTPDTI